MKRFRVVHTTEYSFADDAFNIEVVARLRPRDETAQHCDFFQVVTRPPASIEDLPVDGFGNHGNLIRFGNRLNRLYISAISTVTRFQDRAESAAREGGGPPEASHASLFMGETRLVPLSDGIRRYALQSINPTGSVHDQSEALCSRIHADLIFRAGVTDERTTAEEVLAIRQGVCQDFTHLALACSRSLGWAARYVSGYVHTAASRGKAHRIATDASHAWLEVFDTSCGWLGLDPANNRRADDRYIVVARGRDYDDACPLQGAFEGGGSQQLRVSVDVQQI